MGGGTELVSQPEYEDRHRRFKGQATEIKFIQFKPLSWDKWKVNEFNRGHYSCLEYILSTTSLKKYVELCEVAFSKCIWCTQLEYAPILLSLITDGYVSLVWEMETFKSSTTTEL